MRRLVSLVSLILAIAMASSTPALAQFGGGPVTVFDPSMFARQMQQLQTETHTLTTAAQQLENMVINTVPYAGGVWQPNTNLLNNLGSVIATEQGLSYALTNLSTAFSQLFPGYSAPAGVPAQTAQAVGQGMNATLATLSGSLNSLQGQAQNFAAENAEFQQLATANSAATGRLQAIQVGNQIALLQMQQMQMLRQLMMNLTTAFGVTNANQVSQQAQSTAALQQWLNTSTPPLTNEPSPSAGLIPSP